MRQRLFERGDQFGLVGNLAVRLALGLPTPTDMARYSIKLFKQDGEGIEQVLDRNIDIKVARSIYHTTGN